MKKEFYKTPTTIGAALVIIGFLLPWVSFSFGPMTMSVSGYDIPKLGEMFSGLKRSFDEGKASSGNQLYYVLYLIPLLAGYLIYSEYKNIKKYFVPAKVVIFLLSGFVIYKLAFLGGSISENLQQGGIGLWISVGGGIYLLVQAVKEFGTQRIPASKDSNTS